MIIQVVLPAEYASSLENVNGLRGFMVHGKTLLQYYYYGLNLFMNKNSKLSSIIKYVSQRYGGGLSSLHH